VSSLYNLVAVEKAMKISLYQNQHTELILIYVLQRTLVMQVVQELKVRTLVQMVQELDVHTPVMQVVQELEDHICSNQRVC